MLNTALPIYIENTIYSYVLDSKASEHAARMNSMKSSTDNANEVIASLELLYNRARTGCNYFGTYRHCWWC
ncbi:MAG: F0F1 ATP synthase subunit gamma [Christensenellales bacterium]